MYKGIKGLITNLHKRNFTQSQLKQSVNTKLNRLLLKSF